MSQEAKSRESTEEQIKDAINVLQLLMEELTVNQDDAHILRSVNIVLKILQSALSSLQQTQAD